MVLEEHRPTPEEILKKIRMIDPDETRVRQGRLKIFFGYAAGVGKTYAMLEMAHQMKDMGVDVVAGYIEPHIRPATMKLVEGLECLPPLVVSYKGITLREFDLDAALARKPQLILVDELAHSNAQGCRHVKRYQDIEELLRAGIDVYTTVNVQHLESLNDLVSSLTGVTVNERIPDWVFDSADQVEVVDVEPDDLIARLEEGKGYRAAQAQGGGGWGPDPPSPPARRRARSTGPPRLSKPWATSFPSRTLPLCGRSLCAGPLTASTAPPESNIRRAFSTPATISWSVCPAPPPMQKSSVPPPEWPRPFKEILPLSSWRLRIPGSSAVKIGSA